MSFTSIVSTVDLIAIIKVLIILYVLKYYYKYFTRQSPLPGPFPLPLIGNLHQIRLNPAQYAKEHHKKYGDMYEIWVGNNRFVILSHPSLIDQIYVPNTKTKFFPRSEIKHFNGNGLVFNDDPLTWKRNRKFVVQSLMSPRFLKNFTHLTQSLFNENESYWDKKEYQIDFAKWIKCFTTDITLQTVTCKPSYCLNTYLFGENHDDPIRSEEIKRTVYFTKAVQTFLTNVLFQMFIPEVLKNYFPGFYHLNKKYKKNSDWLTETMLDVISKRRKEIDNMQSDEKIGSNLLDILLTLNTPRDPNGYDESEPPLTDQEVCSTITEVSIAGTDTTGNTFCFTVWLLVKHPKVIARFREEISEILGEDISRQITYEDLEKFTYLDAIIKESTRVLTLTPLTPRISTQESIIGGKHLEANTKFLILHELIHKLPEFWENPDDFIPERFLKETNNEITKNAFIPFGGGTRICPGRHMAMVELKTLLILLFRKYDVELVDNVSKKPKTQFTAVYECTEMKVLVRPKY
ncbi:cytochrome P450 [Rhizophagus irregularis]|uniref:Cytochrome P450 n=1 Tax=Rhizophagus irregularis TaxID=588596 RepID=A0A2I1H6N5_9GLOM|nr:cytochrome P450 [Rhizophagus irregularis]PKY54537.1 cytochrome P450 [Rhizophagus irregularis]